jgi:hypothetical protein
MSEEIERLLSQILIELEGIKRALEHIAKKID